MKFIEFLLKGNTPAPPKGWFLDPPCMFLPVVLAHSIIIPRRSFGQKFLPFSGRAALPVLGRKSAVCRGNVFVAANIPFQESSETKTTYSRGVEYLCGLHWAFLPGTVTAMRKSNLQRLSFHLHLQIWLPSYHICVFAFEGFLCGMITKGLKSV